MDDWLIVHVLFYTHTYMLFKSKKKAPQKNDMSVFNFFLNKIENYDAV